jgi:uncharacterized protein (TIGR00251 family)
MVNNLYRINNDNIILNVKVVPNSKTNSFEGLLDSFLKIKISANPVNGQVNKELIKIISKKFKINKKDILLKGTKSKNKIVTFPKNNLFMEFIQKMNMRL